MKLILHIGQEKTGTTALQHGLYLNEAVLNQHGFCLSHTIDSTNNRGLVACFQKNPDNYFILNNLTSPEAIEAFRNRTLAGFQAEVKELSKHYHTLIVTSEHFQSRLVQPNSIAQLSEYLNGIFDDIDVICYFRRQDSKVSSAYSTHISVGGTGSFSKHLENAKRRRNGNFNYVYFANKWTAHFASSRFMPRFFSRNALEGGDIMVDFFSALGSPQVADDLETPAGERNVSLSRRGLWLLRRTNRLFPRFRNGRESKIHRLVTGVIKASRWAQFGPKLDVTQLDPEFMSHFEKKNRRFLKEYMPHIRPEDF
ncbi:hypothetical protein [uncultured Aliiroseovarius sp.]|uniref:hypothetical protein n=1 Tax=uncultured Aliiroseovarius sp. TaxID=1658783 RepID=UPI002604286B|nr:hypothetical protein [uncultured Aliiroseovarius sp.]